MKIFIDGIENKECSNFYVYLTKNKHVKPWIHFDIALSDFYPVLVVFRSKLIRKGLQATEIKLPPIFKIENLNIINSVVQNEDEMEILFKQDFCKNEKLTIKYKKYVDVELNKSDKPIQELYIYDES